MKVAEKEKVVRSQASRYGGKSSWIFLIMTMVVLFSEALTASDTSRRVPLSLKPDDVLATGNEWVALPTIRASDGALESFSVLSMRERGLLEVIGDGDAPALQPYFIINGKPLPFQNPAWEVIGYWIPEARLTVNDVDMTLTYCAPHGSRGAFIRLTLHNHGAATLPVAMGVRASWGGLNRVTYTPVALRGERTVGPSLGWIHRKSSASSRMIQSSHGR